MQEIGFGTNIQRERERWSGWFEVWFSFNLIDYILYNNFWWYHFLCLLLLAISMLYSMYIWFPVAELNCVHNIWYFSLFHPWFLCMVITNTLSQRHVCFYSFESYRIHLAIDINCYKLHWPMAHLFHSFSLSLLLPILLACLHRIPFGAPSSNSPQEQQKTKYLKFCPLRCCGTLKCVE